MRQPGLLALCCGCLLVITGPADAAPGEEWHPLFDGRSLAGWANEKGEPPVTGWAVENGVLHRAGRGGSLVTVAQYLDFELEFEWKIARGGNSGVKYRLHRTDNEGWLGPEYQILDDALHRDARNAAMSAGALYLLKEPGPEKNLRPPGEFNQARIVARGTILEHWLNGRRILSIDTTGEEWRRKLAASKYSKSPGASDWFARHAGPIMLQDHGSDVWFRNIRIRELK
ncbi:MAG: DUF1080 domain-containing protein [Acidobacteria bacterium]|nr:DUF1080 domain-containing protein [Acidobacteriota bacterium]